MNRNGPCWRATTNTYEAEFAAATLEGSGIPVQIRGLEVGIWGPGHAGPTVTGPSLWVPEDRLAEARDLRPPLAEEPVEVDEND